MKTDLFQGGLFESSHPDENNIQTISHKCEVVSIEEFRERVHKKPSLLNKIYERNNLYYKAGRYDHIGRRLFFETGVLS